MAYARDRFELWASQYPEQVLIVANGGKLVKFCQQDAFPAVIAHVREQLASHERPCIMRLQRTPAIVRSEAGNDADRLSVITVPNGDALADDVILSVESTPDAARLCLQLHFLQPMLNNSLRTNVAIDFGCEANLILPKSIISKLAMRQSGTTKMYWELYDKTEICPTYSVEIRVGKVKLTLDDVRASEVTTTPFIGLRTIRRLFKRITFDKGAASGVQP
eukprot:TRINITY_DN4132_c0_g1_i2.p1 TRINITY_DN4132_c0_g1~~TRINITY_DN4132_c0_g1_i2.p1  ORF type:complete len:220 (-),score=49.46 TRINITY_DN4132_c0_g1_i2:734-1393(-)